MTTRYRLLEPMLVIETERRFLDARWPKRVTPEELSKMDRASPFRGAPTHYAVWPEPDPDCYLPLVKPKKKEE
jgi:hypothetical protein